MSTDIVYLAQRSTNRKKVENFLMALPKGTIENRVKMVPDYTALKAKFKLRSPNLVKCLLSMGVNKKVLDDYYSYQPSRSGYDFGGNPITVFHKSTFASSGIMKHQSDTRQFSSCMRPPFHPNGEGDYYSDYIHKELVAYDRGVLGFVAIGEPLHDVVGSSGEVLVKAEPLHDVVGSSGEVLVKADEKNQGWVGRAKIKFLYSRKNEVVTPKHYTGKPSALFVERVYSAIPRRSFIAAVEPVLSRWWKAYCDSNNWGDIPIVCQSSKDLNSEITGFEYDGDTAYVFPGESYPDFMYEFTESYGYQQQYKTESFQAVSRHRLKQLATLQSELLVKPLLMIRGAARERQVRWIEGMNGNCYKFTSEIAKLSYYSFQKGCVVELEDSNKPEWTGYTYFKMMLGRSGLSRPETWNNLPKSQHKCYAQFKLTKALIREWVESLKIVASSLLECDNPELRTIKGTDKEMEFYFTNEAKGLALSATLDFDSIVSNRWYEWSSYNLRRMFKCTIKLHTGVSGETTSFALSLKVPDSTDEQCVFELSLGDQHHSSTYSLKCPQMHFYGDDDITYQVSNFLRSDRKKQKGSRDVTLGKKLRGVNDVLADRYHTTSSLVSMLRRLSTY